MTQAIYSLYQHRC